MLAPVLIYYLLLVNNNFGSLKYTLGPGDVIGISVRNHPEFSGTYPINLEGKIQYSYVGNIDVRGLTQGKLEEKLEKNSRESHSPPRKPPIS